MTSEAGHRLQAAEPGAGNLPLDPVPGSPESRNGRPPVRLGELPFAGLPPLRQSSAATRPLLFVGFFVLLMVIGGALSALLSRKDAGVSQHQIAHESVLRAAGQSNRLLAGSDAALMGIERLRGAAAPGIALLDQHSRARHLERLARHHAVVLLFLDDRCSGDCPVLTAEVADAYRHLSPVQARRIDFVAVNVDGAFARPAALRAFLAGPGRALASVPDFSYLTGTPRQLRAVWARYGLDVVLNNNGSVVYRDLMDFIAPGDRLAFRATPYSDLGANGVGSLPASMIRQWGSGIARYATALLG